MSRKLKLFLIIFSLGIFILPKQIFFAQNPAMSCCTSQSVKETCCKTDNTKHGSKKPCHKSNKDCDGNCVSCNTCSFSATVFAAVKAFKNTENQHFVEINKANFNYICPAISDIFSKIWQPPKIG